MKHYEICEWKEREKYMLEREHRQRQASEVCYGEHRLEKQASKTMFNIWIRISEKLWGNLSLFRLYLFK